MIGNNASFLDFDSPFLESLYPMKKGVWMRGGWLGVKLISGERNVTILTSAN